MRKFIGGTLLRHPWGVCRDWGQPEAAIANGAAKRQRPYGINVLGLTATTESESGTAPRAGDSGESQVQRRGRLEAVLFLAKTPLSTRKLAQLAHLADGTEARTLVRHLNNLYDETGRSIRIEQVAGGYRLMTRPAFASWLARLGHLPAAVRLSPPMMETLAVVAYRQPVSRSDVEAVRGVACGELLRQLMEKDLVRIAGRSEDLGRPYLYGTTKRFLQLFGLANIEALPPIRWQSFRTDRSERESDPPNDSNPNEFATSTKESVVTTAPASVLCEADPQFDLESGPRFDFETVNVRSLTPRASDEDEDEDFDDDEDEEEDDLDEEDDFDGDWDDEEDLDEEEDDEAEDEAEEEGDDWEEVDDAEEDEDEELEEDEESAEEEEDDDEDDDWDDDDDDFEEDEDDDDWD